MQIDILAIKTTRYSTVFRRILETYNQSQVEIKIDGHHFGQSDIPTLLSTWCTNRNITQTLNFSLFQNGQVLFSFHDHPKDLAIAASERLFVEQLIGEHLVRIDHVQNSLRPNIALHLTPPRGCLSIVGWLCGRCRR